MIFETLTPLPAGEPGLAGDLPAVLGFPDDLLPLLEAFGLRCWSGHHDVRCPSIFPGSILGKQAKVLRYNHG